MKQTNTYSCADKADSSLRHKVDPLPGVCREDKEMTNVLMNYGLCATTHETVVENIPNERMLIGPGIV